MKNMEQLNDQAMENVSGGISEQEAMAAALANIAEEALKAGFKAEKSSGYSNAEYEKLSDDATPECIFGELTIGVEGARETIVFECAVSVFENEGELTVSDEELAQKIGELRGNLRGFIEDVRATGKEDLKDAFIAVINKEEEEKASQIPEEKPRDNTHFYIAAALGALAIAAFFICLKFFF